MQAVVWVRPIGVAGIFGTNHFFKFQWNSLGISAISPVAAAGWSSWSGMRACVGSEAW